MNKVVQFDHMRVGAIGGGKHWTEKEVKNRKEAAEKFNRKKPVRLKIPDWLGEEPRKVWENTVKSMKGFDILDNVDEEVLANYCDTVVRIRELNFVIDQDGFTLQNVKGEMVPNPNVKIVQAYQRSLLQYAGKLGITAEARARLAKKMADAKGDDRGGVPDGLFD